MKIVIDDKIPNIQGALEPVAEVVYLPGGKITKADLADTDAMIIRTRTRCTADLLAGTPVKFIATATIGYDHIDTTWCEQAGIQWTNAPGCNSGSVEQYIVSALLYLSDTLGFSLAGKTLGVVGAGNVGTKVVRAAAALGCRVLVNDPPLADRHAAIGISGEGKKTGSGESVASGREVDGQGSIAVVDVEEFVSLKELLVASDIVTMHVPLNRDGKYRTLGMADENFFARMKQDAVFINSSRGEVVDETALKGAIRSGKLSAAVLDVFAGEPGIDRELLDLLTLATPHIAGYSADGKANGTTMSVQAVSRFFGLGMDSWKPAGVPEPAQKELFADGAEDDAEEVIREIYQQTYDITRDYLDLVRNPEAFEALRGSYPLRREPQAYSARVFNDDGTYREILEQLRFNVIGDSCM